MARKPKTEVAAINIRIPSNKERDYTRLLATLAELKRGIRVYGDSYVAISFFDTETGFGAFSKYTEIDIDGDWFDLEDFDAATPEKLDEIFIPENLRPNHAAFYFKLDSELHVISFESYSDSKSLSARSVERYFREIVEDAAVLEAFGIVEADVVKSYNEVERLLALPDLRELRIVIRRPNEDDLSGGWAKIVEDRLAEQNGEEYEEALKSKDDGLKPNERTTKLAQVAAENGQVKAKSIVNGVLVEQDTSEKPLTEVTQYDKDQDSTRSVFDRLSDLIFGKIREARESLK